MSHHGHYYYRHKRDRLTAKTRHYIDKLSRRLPLMGSKRAKKAEEPITSNSCSDCEGPNAEPSQQTQHSLSGSFSTTESILRERDPEQNPSYSVEQDTANSKLPIPDSLKLFGIQPSDGLPPFFHFPPTTLDLSTERGVEASSNANLSSIISKDIIFSTASTDNGCIPPSKKTFWNSFM